MEPFTVLTAAAVPIDSPNVDTDQIIPARFLKQPRGDGYGRFLFHDLRRNEDGSLKRDHILNRKPFAQARIMVGERNFGCGSSREGAVYAMVDHGFRAVIAPSFGDIFGTNCCKNGVLPIVVSAGLAADLRGQLHAAPGATMTIDLAAHAFAVDPFHKHCLLEGLDDIRLTLEYETDIAAFEARDRAEAPWL
jgi:3-isopropylmalate/(R)-2-methylmalate dehydratase small subunit